MSTVNATIQLDSALKQESQELFDRLGWSLNEAIALFLRQSVREQAFPFRVETPVSKRIGVGKGKFAVKGDFDADNAEIADTLTGGV